MVPGRKTVTLWVSARMAGTGQTVIFWLQPDKQQGAERDQAEQAQTHQFRFFLGRGLSWEAAPRLTFPMACLTSRRAAGGRGGP